MSQNKLSAEVPGTLTRNDDGVWTINGQAVLPIIANASVVQSMGDKAMMGQTTSDYDVEAGATLTRNDDGVWTINGQPAVLRTLYTGEVDTSISSDLQAVGDANQMADTQ